MINPLILSMDGSTHQKLVNINFICPLMITFDSTWTSVILTVLLFHTFRTCMLTPTCKPIVSTSQHGDNTKNRQHPKMTPWANTKATGWISRAVNIINSRTNTSITQSGNGRLGLLSLPNRALMRLTIPKLLKRFKTCVSKQILARPRSGRSLATMFQARVLISLSCHWQVPTALPFSNLSLSFVVLEQTKFIRKFKPSLITAPQAALTSALKSQSTVPCTLQPELRPRSNLWPQNLSSTLTWKRGLMDLHSFHIK